MKKVILFILLLMIAGWQFLSRTEEVKLSPGVQVKTVPYQSTIASPVKHQINNYIITELVEFTLKAKILSRKNYYFDKESDLSPTDLALGWGNMSDERVLEKITISQSKRYYHWWTSSFPIPREEIESHSANMHIIPANEIIKNKLENIRKGDIVKMSGSLVNVSTINGKWHWRSSLTRYDTGSGACELFFVKKIDIVTNQ